MKKILLLMTALLMGVTLSAQNTTGQPQKMLRYRGSVELDGGMAFATMPLDEIRGGTFGGVVGTTHGIELWDCWTIGLGAAIGAGYSAAEYFDEEGIGLIFSGYLHTDYAFLKGAKVRPYVFGRIGYAACDCGAGLAWGTGAGVRFNDRWDLGLGYKQGYDIFSETGKLEHLIHVVFLQFAFRF